MALEQLYEALQPLGLYKLRQDSLVDRELAAYDAGFRAVEALLEDMMAQAFVQTATGTPLAQYEKLVGLPPREELDLVRRRALVLYRLGVAPLDFTPGGLVRSIRAAGMVAEIEEHPAEESIVVRCLSLIDTETDLDRLKANVATMLPAHLLAEFDIGELTWDLFEEADPDWDNWDDLDMRWAEFDLNGHNLFPTDA